MLGSSLDDPCGIVLVFLKSNSKLRLASPWAFYCQAIRIFYHLHYAHEARIISCAAAFRRTPLPPLCWLPGALKASFEFNFPLVEAFILFLMISCSM